MSSLDDNQVIDLTSDALGGMLAAHRRFKERHQPTGAASAAFQRNRIQQRRQLNSAALTASQQHETLPADTVKNPQNNLANSATTVTDVTARLNALMGRSMSEVQPFDDVIEAPATDVIGTSCTIRFQSRDYAARADLEEIVVQADSVHLGTPAPPTDASIISRPFARKQQLKRKPPNLELDEVIVKASSLSGTREQVQSASGHHQVSVNAQVADAHYTADTCAEVRLDFVDSEIITHSLNADCEHCEHEAQRRGAVAERHDTALSSQQHLKTLEEGGQNIFDPAQKIA